MVTHLQAAARIVVSGVVLPFAAVVQMFPSTFSPRSFLHHLLVPSVTKLFFSILFWLPGIICSANFWGGGLAEDDIDLVADLAAIFCAILAVAWDTIDAILCQFLSVFRQYVLTKSLDSQH